MAEENETATESDSEEGEQGNSADSGGSLTSPEGILMLFCAGILDAAGLMVALIGTWFGIDDYGVLDIFGMLTIGGWMLLRGGREGASQAAKKGLRRFLISSCIEIVPIMGGLAPSWTILVYKTLKDG